MADKKKEANDMRYTPPSWAKTLMWWSVGIIVTITIILTIGDYSTTKLGFGTKQKQMIVERSKKTEVRGPRTEIEATEGKWSDPIIRIDGWNWGLDYHAEKKAQIKIERGDKILGEWEFGGGLPPVTTISARPRDKIFFKSLDGTQKISVQYIDRS